MQSKLSIICNTCFLFSCLYVLSLRLAEGPTAQTVVAHRPHACETGLQSFLASTWTNVNAWKSHEGLSSNLPPVIHPVSFFLIASSAVLIWSSLIFIRVANSLGQMTAMQVLAKASYCRVMMKASFWRCNIFFRLMPSSCSVNNFNIFLTFASAVCADNQCLTANEIAVLCQCLIMIILFIYFFNFANVIIFICINHT